MRRAMGAERHAASPHDDGGGGIPGDVAAIARLWPVAVRLQCHQHRFFSRDRHHADSKPSTSRLRGRLAGGPGSGWLALDSTPLDRLDPLGDEAPAAMSPSSGVNVRVVNVRRPGTPTVKFAVEGDPEHRLDAPSPRGRVSRRLKIAVERNPSPPLKLDHNGETYISRQALALGRGLPLRCRRAARCNRLLPCSSGGVRQRYPRGSDGRAAGSSE